MALSKAADTLSQHDTLAADTVVSDTMVDKGMHTGLLLDPDPVATAKARPDATEGDSWVMLGLIVMFVAVCLRIKSNFRYISALLSDLVEVRERHNVFDDTVRETSLLVMLNVLWAFCTGVLSFKALCYYGLIHPASGGMQSVAMIGICAGMSLVYTLFKTIAYTLVGNVFSDGFHTRMWVKGYLAGQGLMAVAFFPLALCSLCYEEWNSGLLITAAVVFILGEIIFIYKGFRIFFTQISSWVLFLYYLCSLEIVPLILAVMLTAFLCSLL